jgi:hypothetical protein
LKNLKERDPSGKRVVIEKSEGKRPLWKKGLYMGKYFFYCSSHA